MDGCLVTLLIFMVIIALVHFSKREQAADNSKPHNWAIIPDSGDIETLYSLTSPKVPYSRYPTYVLSLDEIHTVKLSGEGCSSVIRWKYNGEKIKRNFTRAVENSDGEIVFWGDTPGGIEKCFDKLSYTFWKDALDERHHSHFYTEEQLWNVAKGKPIDILSVEYHDHR